MNTEHTPEPWRYVEMYEECIPKVLATGPTGYPECTASVPVWRRNIKEANANARRIVACVNACAGIPTEALEQFLPGLVKDAVAFATNEIMTSPATAAGNCAPRGES